MPAVSRFAVHRTGRRDRRELRAPARPQRAGADQPAPQRHQAGPGGGRRGHRPVLGHRHHALPFTVGAVGTGPDPGGRRQHGPGLRDAGRLLGPVRRAWPGAGVPDDRPRPGADGPGPRGPGAGAGGDGSRHRARGAEPRHRLAGRDGAALPGPAGRRRRGAARRGRRLRRRGAPARAGARRRGGGGGPGPARSARAGPAAARPGDRDLRAARRHPRPGPGRSGAARGGDPPRPPGQPRPTAVRRPARPPTPGRTTSSRRRSTR